MLYDLTTLQRDANRLLGFTAQQTLDYLQALYEKKLCTYPQTDSRHLTDDMHPALVGLTRTTASILSNPPPNYAPGDTYAIMQLKQDQHSHRDV